MDARPIVFTNVPMFVEPPASGLRWLTGSLAEAPGGVVLSVPDGAVLAPSDPPWAPGTPAVVSCQPDGSLQPRPVGTCGPYELARLSETTAEVVYTSNDTMIYVLPIAVAS